METLDLRKTLKYLYQPSAKEVQVVDVPCFPFLMVAGEIEPGLRPGTSPSFGDDVQAMYGVAYTLKFASKQRPENPVDYPVMPLEGLWWTETGAYDIQRPDGWRYNLLILQPEHITQAMFSAALEKARKKNPSPALDRLKLAEFTEGSCIQIMHLGPYSDEMRTIQKMDDFAAAQGYRMRGKHHEIYLGDPRKAKPENMKTIVRHPIEN